MSVQPLTLPWDKVLCSAGCDSCNQNFVESRIRWHRDISGLSYTPNHPLFIVITLINTYTLLSSYHKQLVIRIHITAGKRAATISVTAAKQRVSCVRLQYNFLMMEENWRRTRDGLCISINRSSKWNKLFRSNPRKVQEHWTSTRLMVEGNRSLIAIENNTWYEGKAFRKCIRDCVGVEIDV